MLKGTFLRNKVPKDLHRLEECAKRNCVNDEFQQGQMQVPLLGREEPLAVIKTRQESVWLEGGSAEMAAKMANSILGCINRSTAIKSRETIIFLLSTCWTACRKLCPLLGPPTHERLESAGASSAESHQDGLKAGALAL